MVKICLMVEKEGLERKIQVPSCETIVKKGILVFDTINPKWRGTYKIKKVETIFREENVGDENVYRSVNIYLRRK